MAYNPTTWTTGDTITATAMNKIENGIANAGSALVVQAYTVDGVITCDHTVQQMHDSMTSGTPVYIAWAYGTFGVDYVSQTYFCPVVLIYTYQNTDVVRVCATNAEYAIVNGISFAHTPAITLFQATSANDYPTFYCSIIPQNSTVEY